MKKYYFRTFPEVWQTKYSLSGKVFADSDMSKIDTYMKLLKQEADKTQKKREKDKKRKQDGNDTNQKKNGYNNKRKRNQGKGGGKQNGKNCCPKHPNAPHTWKECFLNPKNPNNKLNDPKYNPEIRGKGKGGDKDRYSDRK